jgi:hypothetical protein
MSINFGTTVSLKQAANLITNSPELRYFLQGEPGIGKSSIMKLIGNSKPDHIKSYMDCSQLDLGDIAMPYVDKEQGITTYYPNGRFGMHTREPVLMMLDEFTKAAEPVKNMLHPLLESSNPRLGDIPVHPESIIFLTGNLSTDGVGDVLKAHTRNRIIPLNVRKPSSDEWLEWAVNNDIEPIVMSWVHQFPHALASYTEEGQAENPYIFNPKKVQTAFVSPRSLERASHILKQREHLDAESLIAALTGAIGEAGARDMQAYVEYQDQLPTWDSIIKSPESATVPDSVGACAVLVFGAITKVDKTNMPMFMKYLERFEPEWQACFAINIAKNPQKQSVAFSSSAFADWVQKNEDLL